ncbi:MAG: hypothetical protein K2L42_06295 [Clostridia bacterium]|nr:hypothetical protein [Clostridia bacterium]
MIKDYLKDKSIGFWFSAGLSVFSLITAAVYAGCYAGTDDMSWAAFVFILLAGLSGCALIAFKQFKFVPYVIAVLVFLALLFFIYGIYYYVSVVMVGIDLDSFDPQFIVCALFFVLAFGVSIANLFLKQINEKGRGDEQKN